MSEPLWATIREVQNPVSMPRGWTIHAEFCATSSVVLLDLELLEDQRSVKAAVAGGKSKALRNLQGFLFGDAIRLLEEAKSGLLRDSISRKKIDEAISKMVVVERPEETK